MPKSRTMDSAGVAQLIRDHMHALTMSQTEYALHIDVTASHLSQVINGRAAPCKKLVESLGLKKVTIYELEAA